MAQSVRCVLENRHKDLSSGPHVPTRLQAWWCAADRSARETNSGSLVLLASQSYPAGEFWVQKEILFQKIRGGKAGGETVPS